MIYIYLFVFIALMVCSVCFRVAVLNFPQTVFYGVKDIVKWVRYCGWRNLRTGVIIAFVGLFGKGKTLSAVHWVVKRYKKYNNRKIYHPFYKKWVTQKVLVLSNVDLAIPFIPFTGLRQMVDLAEQLKEIDKENDTLTCVLVLGDEFSVQLNSRSFKTNIDPLFLNTLLTCRHHHISLIYTSQRFNHVDALLRQVTSFVISCNKCWRFMVHNQYDAYTLENATDTTLVKPLKRFGWFVRDADFNAYDTLACVENLSKSCKDGDMLTEEEIFMAIADKGVQMDGVLKPSRKYVKSMRRRAK